MIRQFFAVSGVWWVSAYIFPTHNDVDEILTHLADIGCVGADFATACDNLIDNKLNNGLCFSSGNESIMVIGETSSPAQLFNSLTHEITHLAVHIATEKGIDLTSEGLCYLAGEIAQNIYKSVKGLLCECCNK